MGKNPLIILGADHAGFKIKEFIKRELLKKNYPLQDVGTFSLKRVDYPDYAEKLALEVRKNKQRKGILACGTGIGASIAANKIAGIRAALVSNSRDARLSIEHNNANVLVLGGRHQRRLKKISNLEKKYLGAAEQTKRIQGFEGSRKKGPDRSS